MGKMFCEKLKGLRKRAGMTQAQLARELEISPSTIGMYEQGRRMPDTDLMIKISKLFGVSLDYLLGERNHEDRLTNADELADRVGEMLREQEGLMFSGQPIYEQDIELIVQAIREGVHQAFEDKDS